MIVGEFHRPFRHGEPLLGEPALAQVEEGEQRGFSDPSVALVAWAGRSSSWTSSRACAKDLAASDYHRGAFQLWVARYDSDLVALATLSVDGMAETAEIDLAAVRRARDLFATVLAPDFDDDLRSDVLAFDVVLPDERTQIAVTPRGGVAIQPLGLPAAHNGNGPLAWQVAARYGRTEFATFDYEPCL